MEKEFACVYHYGTHFEKVTYRFNAHHKKDLRSLLCKGKYACFDTCGVNDEKLKQLKSNQRNVILFLKPPTQDQIKVKTLKKEIINVCVDPDSTIEGLKAAIEFMSNIPSDQQRLLFKGKQLEDERKLLDYKIQDGTLVHLVLRLRGGGGGFEFDSMEKAETRQWSSSAPDYRLTEEGLCLEGTCNNANCKAHKKQVVCNIGFAPFQFTYSELQDVCCPLCNEVVVPKKVGFNNCFYTARGRKTSTDSSKLSNYLQPVTFVGNEYKLYNSGKEISWDCLEFDVWKEGECKCVFCQEVVSKYSAERKGWHTCPTCKNNMCLDCAEAATKGKCWCGAKLNLN